MDSYDFLIVGCGISGITVAERLASEGKKRCLIIDRRSHIGGNCHDRHDESGVLFHKYGPHYFRTNSRKTLSYLSRFTEWISAKYEILSHVDGTLYHFPINLNTFEQILKRPSTEEEMKETLESWRIPVGEPKNSEEKIISQVGKKLYEMFYRGYTIKQWKLHPRELSPSVCGRIPIRTNRDNRYFSDTFQLMPEKGYTEMFRRMLDNPRITTRLELPLEEARRKFRFPHMIYCGPIDSYYNFHYGRLPYRSLRFEKEVHEKEFCQPAVQINYPNDHEHTRVVEIKHVTRQKIPRTLIVKEYPADYRETGEAYYPIPCSGSSAVCKKYKELSRRERDVSFLGRLATYSYINMDQAVAKARVLGGTILADSGIRKYRKQPVTA